MTFNAEGFVRRATAFEAEAHNLLSTFDSNPSRVIELVDARKQLTILSLRQDELLREALEAIGFGLFRPGIVMAWAAFMDFLEEKIGSDNLVAIHAKRPALQKCSTVDEIKESISEHQIIDVAFEVKIINKSEKKALHGLLSKRNECAHPTGYLPTLSEAVGFVAELLNRVPTIDQRSPKP